MRNLLNLNRLAWLTCIGMFIVVVMGTLVTKTDSGRGCGNDWPLCNGKFIPDHTISSVIEYSHRFVTGIEGFLVLAVFLVVWIQFKSRDAKLYAASALLFTIVQALLGALAVVWPQSAAVLALHFGFSLLAFVSTLLLALVLQGLRPGLRLNSSLGSNVSSGLRKLIYFTICYSYAVVYMGAFVKHTNSSGGCSGWPLCNGAFIPELTGATRIVFIHRMGALVLFILIALITFYTRKGTRGISAGSGKVNGEVNSSISGVTAGYYNIYHVQKVSLWTFYLVCLQVLSGAFVTYSLGTDWYLTAGMVHALTIACLFGSLCYLGLIVRRRVNT